MSEDAPNKAKSVLTSLAIVVILGLCAWKMFGETAIAKLRYGKIKPKFNVTVEERHSTRITGALRQSHLWKVYVGHMPASQREKHQIDVFITLKRKLFGPPSSDSNTYNSNGHVDMTIRVTETGNKRPILTANMSQKLPALFDVVASSTGDAQEDVFRDAEREAVDYAAVQLEAAALTAMGNHPVRAKFYAPELVKQMASRQPPVAKAATEALLALGQAASCVKPQLKKLADSDRAIVQRSAKGVLAELEK